MYEYVHIDDLENIRISFEALLKNGEGETEDYRILTKGSQWIVVKTSSYISYNHWNSKPEFICSTHQLVKKTPKYSSKETKIDRASSWKVEGSGTVSTKHEYFNDGQSNVCSEINTSSLQDRQIKDTVTNKTLRMVEIAQNEYPKSGRNETVHNSQQFDGLTHETSPCSPAINNNSQSPVAARYWSGQSTSQNSGFYNPLVVSPQSRQQNFEWFTSLPVSSSTVGTDPYSQSSRVVQEYTECNVRTNPYPQTSRVLQEYTEISSAPNTWQSAGHPQSSSETPSEFSPPSSQVPQGYFPSSPVTSERTFQPQRQSFNHLSLASTSLPPSIPVGENYLAFPTTARVISPQISAESSHKKLSSLAGYPATPERMVNSYPQSPCSVIHHSPQSHQTDEYSPSSPLLSTSPQPRTMSEYPTQYYAPSPQVPDRYPQSPAFSPRSPHSSEHCNSPYSPDNFSQPPSRYPALSPAYHQSPSRAHHISNETNELYPATLSYSASSMNERRTLPEGYHMSHQSNTTYSQSPYDYPVRSPQTPTTSTERYLQPSQSPCTIQQDTINHPRSPENNLRSSVLSPPVRHNAVSDQSTPNPIVSRIINPFPVQSDQQRMTSAYHQAQFKKSADESLQSYQGSSVSRHGAGLSNSSRTQNNISRRRSLEQQGLRERERQIYQTTEGSEQTLETRIQDPTISSMLPAKTNSYVTAQKMIQNQLFEKQSQLQNVIRDQKALLFRIQKQIIQNAQSSLVEIGDLESTKQFQQHVYDLAVERKRQETREKELRSVFQQTLNGHKNDREVNVVNTAHSSDESQNLENSDNDHGEQTRTSKRFEENLFRGVLTSDREQSSGNYYTLVAQSVNPHSSTSSSLPQSKSNDVSTNEIRGSTVNTREDYELFRNRMKDYFSKFSASELETFLSSSPDSCSASSENDASSDNAAKQEITNPTTYETLLLQQKHLIEMQEEQRRQLVRRQQEELLKLQRQQQQQRRMLGELQHTSENTSQNQLLSEEGATSEDSNSELFYQLSSEDINVVNMLLSEEVGSDLWTNELFDTT